MMLDNLLDDIQSDNSTVSRTDLVTMRGDKDAVSRTAGILLDGTEAPEFPDINSDGTTDANYVIEAFDAGDLDRADLMKIARQDTAAGQAAEWLLGDI